MIAVFFLGAALGFLAAALFSWGYWKSVRAEVGRLNYGLREARQVARDAVAEKDAAIRGYENLKKEYAVLKKSHDIQQEIIQGGTGALK